ncbi:MAG TPA: glycosyltransferase family 9 protein [Chthoniobacterales bacterium]|nr:glycosyltransferase family 9 protein [Chthoniobacterales bacterium]
MQRSGFFAKGADLNQELSAYFRSFDLVVSYLFDPDEVFRQNVVRCGVETFIACSSQIKGGEHATMQLARPLEQLGLTLRDPAARLFPAPADREFARAFLSGGDPKLIAVHPGSGSPAKNWPIERWLELLQSFAVERLLVIAGEADDKQLVALEATMRMQNIRVATNLPLPQLAAVIESCGLFIGHDSGISHIAAAVGTRCVLLFGPTDPDVWAPAGGNVDVISASGRSLAELSVAAVRDVAQSAIDDVMPTRSSRASEDGEGPHGSIRVLP